MQRPLTGVAPRPLRGGMYGRRRGASPLKSLVDTERLLLPDKERLSDADFEYGARELKSPDVDLEHLRLANLQSTEYRPKKRDDED